jgi:nicotinamidase-related amidase
VVDKTRYSAFYGTNLEAILWSKGIDTLIISGTVTNVRCESTIRDACSGDSRRSS